MKKLFRTQAGRFVAGAIAFLLVALIATGAGQMNFLKKDITEQRLMTMSEQAKEIVSAVDQEVVIYQLATESTKDQWTAELIRQYTLTNENITYELLDPASVAAQKLIARAGTEISVNSLIVTSGDRIAPIAAEYIYQSVYNQQMLYNYGQYVLESQAYAADNELANAILYVTRDDMPVIYALTGHGETAVGSLMQEILREKNILLKTISLTGEVPEDAGAILIHGITSDLTDEETASILSYLKEGGRIILMTGIETESLPNLEAIAAYYGMQPTESTGVVLDPAPGYCYSAEYIQYLQPDLADHVITGTLVDAGAKTTVGLNGAIERNSIRRAGLAVTELMTTSDEAYMKNMESTSLEKEEGDADGPFTVAMTASEGDTRFVWYASGTVFTDNEIAISNGMGLYLLRGTLDWMVKGSESVSIDVIEISSVPISVPADMTVVVYAALFVPALAMLVIGIIKSRRKKA